MVLEIGGRRLYSCYFVGCCFQDLFITARSILVQWPSSFFSIRFVNVNVVHPNSSMDTTVAWKKIAFYFIRQVWPPYDWHPIDSCPYLRESCIDVILDFFDIVAGVLQGDTLTPYLFIIHRDYILWTSIDLMKENGFTLAKAKSRRYHTLTLFTNPSAWAGYDTRSTFKRSLTGLNSEFSFS